MIFAGLALEDAIAYVLSRPVPVRRLALAGTGVYAVSLLFMGYTSAFRSTPVYRFYDAARWIKTHTDSSDTIGVFQSGAIGYLSGRTSSTWTARSTTAKRSRRCARGSSSPTSNRPASIRDGQCQRHRLVPWPLVGRGEEAHGCRARLHGRRVRSPGLGIRYRVRRPASLTPALRRRLAASRPRQGSLVRPRSSASFCAVAHQPRLVLPRWLFVTRSHVRPCSCYSRGSQNGD